MAAISGLYAQDAFWQQDPFRDPEPGYLARVFAEEESAHCRFGSPVVDGDQAAVPWSAQTRLANGETEDLAGVSLLRFRADGLVVEERDFWNRRLDRRPGGWLRVCRLAFAYRAIYIASYAKGSTAAVAAAAALQAAG